MDATTQSWFLDANAMRDMNRIKAGGGKSIPKSIRGDGDFTAHPAFLDREGMAKSNQVKAFGREAAVSIPHRSAIHAPAPAPYTPHRASSGFQEKTQHGLSPFLTAEEQQKLAKALGVKLHPSNCVTPLERAPKIDEFVSSYSAMKPEEPVAEKMTDADRGFQLLTNNEAVALKTREMGISKDVDGNLAWQSNETATMSSMPTQSRRVVDSEFQDTVAFSTFKPFTAPVAIEDSYLPPKKFTNVKEWNKYLFDQMISGDVGFSKEHLDGIKEDIYNKLKLIHMGHESTKENTKNLLDMYDFLKAPSGPVKVENVDKLQKGAKIAELFKNGISELLDLSKALFK